MQKGTCRFQNTASAFRSLAVNIGWMIGERRVKTEKTSGFFNLLIGSDETSTGTVNY